MMMRPWILSVLLGAFLVGCQTIEPGPPPERIEVIETQPAPESREREPSRPTPDGVPRQVAFPEAEYAALEQHGNAVLTGRLTLGGRAGADRVISVAPVTTYSAEAASQALAGRAVEPADPRARAYTHTTRTDAQGNFRVANLPAGEYYVSASMRDPRTGEGRLILHQVSLANGQRRSLDLSR